jgi:hypothetical protein
MPKIEVPRPGRKHNGDQYYGDNDGRDLAEIPLTTKGLDPISYTGEGFISGAKEGVRNGFILAAVGFGIIAYGVGRVIIPMTTLAGTNKAASDLDALEFQKSRLQLKERVLFTLSEPTSYNQDSRGALFLTPEAKSTIKFELESLSEFPGVRQKPEFKALEATFLSSNLSLEAGKNNEALMKSFELLKTSYRDDWKKISKALVKIGDDSDLTPPMQIGRVPSKVQIAIVK